MQFAWAVQERFLPRPNDSVFIGYQVMKFVFDKGHSDDEMAGRVISENFRVWRQGIVTGTSEEKRSEKMSKAAANRRAHTNDANMETTAKTQ